MTSGQNNIIVSEIGYCAEDVNEGIACGGDGTSGTVAASDLTEMLDHAKRYHEAGWLKALIIFSRNDGGWAMESYPAKTLTKSGEALDVFAESLVGWAIELNSQPGTLGGSSVWGVVRIFYCVCRNWVL